MAERNQQNITRGRMSAAAGPRKIEYSAETILELGSEGNIPGANDEVPVSLKLSKNRNGVIGRSVELRFNGALQTYREI